MYDDVVLQLQNAANFLFNIKFDLGAKLRASSVLGRNFG